MSDSDLQVGVTVDASGARRGADEAKSAVAGIGPPIEALAKTFSELGKSLKEGFDGLGKIGKAIAGIGKDGGGELQGVATSLKSIGEAASGLGGVASALGEVALGAAKATAEWAQRTQDSATASAEARQNAANLNEAIGEARTSFSAVGDTLANAFAPVLTTVIDALTGLANGFRESYDKGGAARAIVDTLILAFKLLTAGVEIAIGAIIAVIESVRSQIQQWGDRFQAVSAAVEDAVDVQALRFKTLAQVVKDVFSGDFGKAFGDYQAGLAQIEKRTQQAVASIQQQLAKLRADQIAGGEAELRVVTVAAADLAGLSSGSSHAARAGSPGKRSGHGAAGAHGGGASAPPKEACACDPAAAAACEQQAQTGRTEAAAQGAAQRSDDHAQANATMAASDSGATIAAASNQAQQVATAEGADRARVASNAAANRQMAAANDKTLKQFEASMKRLVDMFADGLAKMAEGSETFGQVVRKIGQQILQDVFRVVVSAVEKWVWGETEKVLASQQAQALLNALGLRDLAVSIMRDRAKAASAVAAEKVKTAATQAGTTQGLAITGQAALKDIVNDAAKAASGAYSATVKAIPAPLGPILGAGAAAAAFAAVIAFKGLVSSAAGGYDIPAGVNPLTQLHAQEMVLPARLANPMRDMLASFGSGGAPTMAGHSFSFGDTHIHGAPNMSPSDFKQALAEHRANVAEAVANALHGGWRPSYRQPVGAL